MQKVTICITVEIHLSSNKFPYLQVKKEQEKKFPNQPSQHNINKQIKTSGFTAHLGINSCLQYLPCSLESLCCKTPTSCVSQLAVPSVLCLLSQWLLTCTCTALLSQALVRNWACAICTALRELPLTWASVQGKQWESLLTQCPRTETVARNTDYS